METPLTPEEQRTEIIKKHYAIGELHPDALKSIHSIAQEYAESYHDQKMKQAGVEDELLLCIKSAMVEYYRQHNYRELYEYFTAVILPVLEGVSPLSKPVPPTDAQIEEMAEKIGAGREDSGLTVHEWREKKIGFEEGAKWMRSLLSKSVSEINAKIQQVASGADEAWKEYLKTVNPEKWTAQEEGCYYLAFLTGWNRLDLKLRTALSSPGDKGDVYGNKTSIAPDLSLISEAERGGWVSVESLTDFFFAMAEDWHLWDEEDQGAYPIKRIWEAIENFKKRNMSDKSGWISVADKKPECDKKHNTSDYLLCVDEAIGLPFVAWYESKENKWTVAHHAASSESVNVTHYRDLIKFPLPTPPTPAK